MTSLRIAEAADGFLLNLRLDPARVAAVEERRRRLPGRAGCGVCCAQSIAAGGEGLKPLARAALETLHEKV